MKKLTDIIQNEGRYLGDSILKVDSFLNHQVDGELMMEIGQQLFERLNNAQVNQRPITKILTAEASGIVPALATAIAGGCRMIYARKSISKTMTDTYYSSDAVSRTRGSAVTFYVNSRFLSSDDNILIIEDFLATGSSIGALMNIAHQVGANIAGIGTVIEKPCERGREALRERLVTDCPIASLACLHFEDNQLVTQLGCLAIESRLNNEAKA